MWCEEEFSVGYVKAIKGHERFIIFIMAEDIDIGDLPGDMQHYAKTRTYLEVKDMELFRKKFLHMMPQTPIKHVKTPVGEFPLYTRMFHEKVRFKIPTNTSWNTSFAL